MRAHGYGLVTLGLLAFVACASGDEEQALGPQDAGPGGSGSSGNRPSDAAARPDSDVTSNADAAADGPSDALAPGAVSWARETVALDTVTLQAVWGSSPTDVWAAGSAGTIVHYDGQAWQAVPSNTAATFHSIWGSGPTDVWIAATTDVLFHGGWNGTSASGVNEVVESDAPPVTLYGVYGTGPDDVWVVGDYAILYFEGNPRTIASWRWDGTSWSPKLMVNDFSRPGGNNRVALRSAWLSSPSDVWFGGSFGRSYRNPTFDPLAPPSTEFVAFSAPFPPWEEYDSASRAELEATWGSSANDVWTAGRNGVVRHWDGSSTFLWNTVDVGTTTALHAVWGRGPNDVWVVGDDSTILHWDGAAWSREQTEPGLRLQGIWGTGDDVWIVGEGVVLRRSKEVAP